MSLAQNRLLGELLAPKAIVTVSSLNFTCVCLKGVPWALFGFGFGFQQERGVVRVDIGVGAMAKKIGALLAIRWIDAQPPHRGYSCESLIPPLETSFLFFLLRILFYMCVLHF